MGKNRRISSTPLYQCALGSPLICEVWRGRVWQMPKWEKAPLQKSCKRQNEEKRSCRSPAKPRKFFEVPAGVPQALTLIQYEEWECSLSTVHAKK